MVPTRSALNLDIRARAVSRLGSLGIGDRLAGRLRATRKDAARRKTLAERALLGRQRPLGLRLGWRERFGLGLLLRRNQCVDRARESHEPLQPVDLFDEH